MIFNWYWTNDQTESWLAQKSFGKKEEADYIGSVRTGNICFDLVEREIDGECFLCADLYVGGIDSGYGYGEDGYPYDYFDHVCFMWKSEELLNMNLQSLRKTIGEVLTGLIIENNDESSGCSLIEKANEELKIW